MHYTQFWRITHSPFVTTGRHRMYHGGSVEEAQARIRFIIKNRSAFGVLVGPSLVGKSTLLKSLTDQLAWSSQSTRLVYLSLLNLDIDSMLSTLSEKLSGSEASLQNVKEISRERRWRQLEDAMRGVVATYSQVVLFVDDCHVGSHDLYMIIRRITGSFVPVTCVLSVSEEHFHDLPRGLIDRCQLRIQLPAWDLGQTADYFEYCMDVCKGRDSIFDAQAITRIHELSEGLPYKINYLADLGLVAGALRRAERITESMIDDVAMELSMHPTQPEYEMATFDPSEPAS